LGSVAKLGIAKGTVARQLAEFRERFKSLLENSTARQVGWAYVIYATVVFLVFWFVFVSEVFGLPSRGLMWLVIELVTAPLVAMLMTILFPSIIAIGGFHSDTGLYSFTGLLVLVLSASWAILGWSVLLSAIARWRRGRT